ncbi:MAG: DUF1554 domain-containing protein [Myxococcaceae bacterium]
MPPPLSSFTPDQLASLLAQLIALYDTDSPSGSLPTYTIGGTITGLTMSSLVLQNNLTDNLTVGSSSSGSTSFTFATRLNSRTPYSVTVSTQPTGPYCTVTNASGTVTSANISNIVITCANKKIFATTSTYAANFGGHAAADTTCTNHINCPGTCKAMLVDSTRTACTTSNCSGGASENVNWVFHPNTTYTRFSDGAIIGTTTSAGIFTFPLTNRFDNNTLPNVFSALNADWTTGSSTCSNWTSNASSSVNYGYTGFTNSGSISQGGNCSTAYALLCVEQ